ncbi:hypothetical protein LXL04_007110 [Taraxacum kok-saghyz]
MKIRKGKKVSSIQTRRSSFQRKRNVRDRRRAQFFRSASYDLRHWRKWKSRRMTSRVRKPKSRMGRRQGNDSIPPTHVPFPEKEPVGFILGADPPQAQSTPAVGPQFNGSSPGPDSSPNFVNGESNRKRRRSKKKSPGHHSAKHKRTQHPSSGRHWYLDLNRNATGSSNSSTMPQQINSPSHVSPTFSSEMAQTIEIGNEVGFRVDDSHSSTLKALNGGGDNQGRP